MEVKLRRWTHVRCSGDCPFLFVTHIPAPSLSVSTKTASHTGIYSTRSAITLDLTVRSLVVALVEVVALVLTCCLLTYAYSHHVVVPSFADSGEMEKNATGDLVFYKYGDRSGNMVSSYF